MVERRKIMDRRVNPPKQGLPFYYTRHIADRRAMAQRPQWNARRYARLMTSTET